MLNFLNKKHTTGIVHGIIATFLFIYFLQPILDRVSRFVIYAFSLFSSAFSDRIFMQVAHLQTEEYSFYVWQFCIILLIGFLTGYCTFLLSNLFDKQSSHVTISKALTQLESNGVFYRYFIVALCFICTVLGIVTISAGYIQLKTISSFQQHMRIIAPYISEGEEKIIFSQWSLMKSHSDYESVYAIIRSKAKEHNIVLPENTIYSTFTL